MKIKFRRDYRELRRAAYPSIGDQLDAVIKLAQHLQGAGMTLPDEVSAWVESCQRVKDAHPK